MLITILLVFHIIVCILLIATVLMQQSEGGALGMGGGPSGFMTARGAGNLLTRTTWVLFSLFLLLSIALTILGGQQKAASQVSGRGVEAIDPSKAAPAAPTTPAAPAPGPLTAPSPESGFPVDSAPAGADPAGFPAPNQ